MLNQKTYINGFLAVFSAHSKPQLQAACFCLTIVKYAPLSTAQVGNLQLLQNQRNYEERSWIDHYEEFRHILIQGLLLKDVRIVGTIDSYNTDDLAGSDHCGADLIGSASTFAREDCSHDSLSVALSSLPVCWLRGVVNDLRLPICQKSVLFIARRRGCCGDASGQLLHIVFISIVCSLLCRLLSQEVLLRFWISCRVCREALRAKRITMTSRGFSTL